MNRGDVVLVQWVGSDLRLGKRRPAVVVQADFLNTLIANTILVQITNTLRNARTEGKWWRENGGKMVSVHIQSLNMN